MSSDVRGVRTSLAILIVHAFAAIHVVASSHVLEAAVEGSEILELAQQHVPAFVTLLSYHPGVKAFFAVQLHQCAALSLVDSILLAAELHIHVPLMVCQQMDDPTGTIERHCQHFIAHSYHMFAFSAVS